MSSAVNPVDPEFKHPSDDTAPYGAAPTAVDAEETIDQPAAPDPEPPIEIDVNNLSHEAPPEVVEQC
jgi:hypothetical protein